MSEVHHFNKFQQNIFLPHIKQGFITFIGITTENLFLTVNSGLLSRTQIYMLVPSFESKLVILFQQEKTRVLYKLNFSNDARKLLIDRADGDTRRLLNLPKQIQTIAETEKITEIKTDYVLNFLTHGALRFNRSGDKFYGQISDSYTLT